MKRFYTCSVIDSDSNKIENLRVPDDCLLNFLEVVMCSDFQLVVNDVFDYDR